jgi:hypothetical protein
VETNFDILKYSLSKLKFFYNIKNQNTIANTFAIYGILLIIFAFLFKLTAFPASL